MKQAYILVEDLYEEMEFWYPYFRLKEAAFKVVVVAPEKGKTYVSKHGYPVVSEAAASEVDANAAAVLVVPGGYAPDKLRRYPDVLKLVKEAHGNGAVCATICHGAWVFISAGIIKGKRATCVPAIRDDLKNAGGIYVDEAAVVDGTMVTSRTPADLPEFMRTVINLAG